METTGGLHYEDAERWCRPCAACSGNELPTDAAARPQLRSSVDALSSSRPSPTEERRRSRDRSRPQAPGGAGRLVGPDGGKLGLEEFLAREAELADEPMDPGPFEPFLVALSRIQDAVIWGLVAGIPDVRDATEPFRESQLRWWKFTRNDLARLMRRVREKEALQVAARAIDSLADFRARGLSLAERVAPFGSSPSSRDRPWSSSGGQDVGDPLLVRLVRPGASRTTHVRRHHLADRIRALVTPAPPPLRCPRREGAVAAREG